MSGRNNPPFDSKGVEHSHFIGIVQRNGSVSCHIEYVDTLSYIIFICIWTTESNLSVAPESPSQIDL